MRECKLTFVMDEHRREIGDYVFGTGEPQVGDILKGVRCETLKDILASWEKFDLEIVTRMWEYGEMKLEVGVRERVIVR